MGMCAAWSRCNNKNVSRGKKFKKGYACLKNKEEDEKIYRRKNRFSCFLSHFTFNFFLFKNISSTPGKS
jgi:hypothetical protein